MRVKGYGVRINTGGAQPAPKKRFEPDPPIKWAKHVDEDETRCVDCGWPLSAVTGSALYAGKDAEGERLFRHYLCPSLSQRRELRRRALVNA